MPAIPRYRTHYGPAILSAGFRPFFLGASIWAALAIPLWLLLYSGEADGPTAWAPVVWHIHEMVYGFAAATVAGFLLTAIPNWTGRMPLQGGPLLGLVLLWAAGRVAVLFAAHLGALATALADLSFPAVFLGVVAREIVAGRNWRNLPMMTALGLLLLGNMLVHLDPLTAGGSAEIGNRLGIATLLLLISLVGGRIVPSFTRNWLSRQRPAIPAPTPEGRFDYAVMGLTALALLGWAVAPDSALVRWTMLLAGLGNAARLVRWRGFATAPEPLLVILHVGYGWLCVGLLLLGAQGFLPGLPPSAAVHALTVGAIGTMTLAVMTRASLGHTGRPLAAGPRTTAIYVLVTAAAVLRLAAAFSGGNMLLMLWLAGAAWAGAFGLFAFVYGRILAAPRAQGDARPL